ncbi:MAG: TetR/AcrR family transcriptional regulator [Anaerovoracaceae bacterium]|jgi:AcrR family transcriptional regulator
MSITEKLIRETFVEMLKEDKLSHITVKKIAERCGISRNSFYYHYANIPVLLESIVQEGIDRIIESIPENASLEERIMTLYRAALDHKRFLMHIHFSGSRDVSDEYLSRLCHYVTTRFLESRVYSSTGSTLPEKSRKLLHSFITYELLGQFTDWFNHHMPESFLGEIHDLCTLLERNSMAFAGQNAGQKETES